MMIMSWMLNSMKPDVSEGLYELNTAKKVWDTVYDLYADKNNMTRIYEVKQLIANHRQGEKSTSSYYTKLRSYWQELSYLRNIEFYCQKDAEEYKKRVEMDQVFDFLVGLNSNFEPVRVQILNETVLPSLSAAYALVLKDEKRRAVMSTNPPEGSALTVVQGRGRGRGQENVSMLMLPLVMEEDKEEVPVVVELELRIRYVHIVVAKIILLIHVGTYMANRRHELLTLLQQRQILLRERIHIPHQVLLQLLMKLLP